ncbi:MAG: glycosyltransferase family 39 protein [Candidatus Kerfeldbacteria bacterium]|nr:glycosyltransferase family 39 protein [Candidatus Kerfeldbacteria bacterium]
MQILTSIPRRIGFGAPLFVVAVLLVLSSAVFFWKLGVKPLENWDEGIHAEVTREVLANQAWLSLSYRDDYYTAKPPLKFWLTAPLFAASGPTEFNARFWSAVAGVLTTILIGWWAFQWNRSVRFALLTGGIFLFGRFVMYHAFRTGETDGLLVLFVTAAMYAYWKLQDDQRWLIVFGAMTGLAIMTKSVGGFIPLMVAAVDLTLSRGWRTINRRTWLMSIGAAAIIALPWHLLELLRHGREFIDGYIGFNVVQRSGDVLYANDVPWWWYADIIVKRMIPFGSFLPLALVLAARRMRRGRDVLDRIMLIWAVVVFVIFSLVQTKFDWYVLPLYVPLAFLLARAFSEFLHQDRDRFLIITAGLSFAVFVFRMPLEFVAQGWLWRLTPYAYLPSGMAGNVLGRGLVALVTTAGVGLLIWTLRKRLVIASTRAVGMIVVVYLCVLAAGWQFSYLRHLPVSAPLKTIAEKVEALDARSIDVVGINLATQPAGNFYLRRIADLEVREIKADQPRQSELVLTTVENRPNDAKNAILEVGPYVLYSADSQGPL